MHWNSVVKYFDNLILRNSVEFVFAIGNNIIFVKLKRRLCNVTQYHDNLIDGEMSLKFIDFLPFYIWYNFFGNKSSDGDFCYLYLYNRI